MGGKTVKKLKQILAFVLICVLFSSTVQAQGIRENEENKYEKIIEMYLNGEDMAEEAVVYRKETAKRLGLEAYLDEKSYLTPEYRFENGIGQDGDITDPDLNILVEMATRKDMEKILEKSQFNQAKPYEEDDRTLVERGFTPGQTVGVTQRKRVSGAGNGYFEISGANSYGYCAQNKKSFWGNDQTKYGPVQEWNDPIVRKILYYSPGGPGYTGGNLGYDMDNATFAVGYQNDSCNNKGRARSYIASLSGKTDPIAWGYRAYIADITPDNYQDIAFLGYIPPAPKQGNVTLKKVSANPSLTNGNSCYSLAGAQFGVYSSSSLSGASRVGTLTTDANGNSNTLKLNAGTYYVKEIVAPKGYALNPETKSVYIPAGGTASVSFADLPQMNPVGILLGKVDAETNQNKPQGSATLQGAQFTVKYYAGLWEANKDPATLGKTPSRTWVFQTDKDGYTSYSKNYLVTGSELYLSSTGHPAIPIGTITIQETKAPEGYLLNPEVFVRQITPSGATENVNTYNKPTIPENIFKLDLKKEQEGTDIPIPGAKFEHTKPDGTKETLTTDENGALTFKALQHGHHAITELEVMDGYVVNENIIEFDVAEDNKVTLTSTTDPTLGNIKFEVTAQGNISLTVEDLLAPFSLKIHKLNNKDKLLAGAEFTLFSDQDCTQEVTKGITDDQGILNFNELKVGQKYYLQETKAPAGYRLPLDENGNLVTYEVYTESTPVKDEFIFYVNGEAFTSDSEGMFTVTGTKADRVAEMTIINNIGMKLPNTGSNTTLLLMMAALILGIILLFRYTLERRRTMKKKTLKMFMALAMSTIVAMGGVTSSIGSLQVQAAETRTTVNTPNGVADFGRGDASITIQGNEGQTLAGKKFNVYQLFDAENAVGGESINYTFNEPYEDSLKTVVGEKLGKDAAKVTEYEVIDYIQSLNNNQVEGSQTEQNVEGSYSEFRYFVEELRDQIVKDQVAADVVLATETKEDNSIEISGLEYGYYVVDEVSDVEGTHSAASMCIVNTANPKADVNIKSDYPKVIKKIQEDDNKDEIGNDGWNDIGDYEIGQTVPYKFESNIPNINGYDTYYYAWHDVMDEALTFDPDSVTIQIQTEDKMYELAKEEFQVITNPGNGETFKVEVQDIKAIVDREFNKKNDLDENVYGQKVVLRYDATLNDKAAEDTGRPGFENDVRLEFSNNPDGDGDGDTGYTPWDTVVCFTYKINILKTNDHNLQLEGAKFRLYSDPELKHEVYVKKTENGYNVINRDSVGGTDHTGGEQPADAVEMVSNAEGTFIIYGLDSGTYYLKETKAPTGYRPLLDPIVLNLKATFTDDRNDYIKGDGATDKTLQNLETTAHIKEFLNGAYKETDVDLTTDVEEGSSNLTVINAVGKKLPITGSSVALIMLVAGTALVAGAFVYGKHSKKENE